MFEFGGLEFLIVGLAVLLILGPTKLPELARTLGLWLGRIRRVYNNFKLEVEREVGMDEVRQQLHNEQIMAEMKSIERETHSILKETDTSIRSTTSDSSAGERDELQPAKSNPVG